jgi:hypothetical protein
VKPRFSRAGLVAALLAGLGLATFLVAAVRAGGINRPLGSYPTHGCSDEERRFDDTAVSEDDHVPCYPEELRPHYVAAVTGTGLFVVAFGSTVWILVRAGLSPTRPTRVVLGVALVVPGVFLALYCLSLLFAGVTFGIGLAESPPTDVFHITGAVVGLTAVVAVLIGIGLLLTRGSHV